MTSSHPSKIPNSSRYPSLPFRPSSSKGSALKRPTTASSALPYSPPSPTAPVFVVSRRVAEAPEPVYSKPAHRQSFSNISNWALTVEPGTPPPSSPVKKSTRSSRRESTPAIPISPITSSHHNTMPRHYEAPTSEFMHAPPPVPSTNDARTGRFRSLGALNPMKRSKSTAPAPKKQPASSNSNKPITRENIPPALMTELLLMQYTGGGSIETHIKSLMDAQAKQAAKNGQNPSVGGVYRDEEGQVWWDEAEKVEYDSLLGERRPSATDSWERGRDENRSRSSRGQDRRRPALQISTPSSGFEDSFVPQTAPIRDAKKRSHVRGMFGMH